MTYQIERDIEIPPRGGAKYPWAEMEPGDSILVDEPYTKGRGSAAGSSASSWVKRNHPEWSTLTRRIDEKTVRVWFTEVDDIKIITE